MGKRSNFARRPMDDYATPPEAVAPLIPYLRANGIETFAEPCCGEGNLVDHLEVSGLRCVYADDIRNGSDARSLSSSDWWVKGTDAIITNPPWTREILHPLIQHFMIIKPTWLLFDADWMHTRQAAPYLPHCLAIVSVGRVKWIPGSPFTGKDNCAWHVFDQHHTSGPRFFGREEAA